MDPLTRDDPGEIAGYRLRARLGAGGMGRVYLAFTPGGRAVAVKVMRPELGDNRDFRQRFRQEVESARRVQGLYTAQVIDADPTAVPPWLVTAYVPGPSLQQAITEHGPMPVQTVFQLVAGVAESLQAIHAAGVVHRDLKPSNVLLAPDGPRVIDFGIARAADATALTHTGMRVGSPQFMAPEQAAGQPATPATDIFGLGSLAAFAVLGRAPFGDGDGQAVLYRILNRDPNLEGCPLALRTVIERCLAKEPAYRPAPSEIIRYCQAQQAGHATEIGQSWLPPGMAADLAYHSALVSTPPTETAPAREPVREPVRPLRPTPTAVATAAAATAAAGAPQRPPGWAPSLSPPSSIVNAVRLMYAGAAGAVVNAIVGSVAVYSIVHSFYAKYRNVSPSTVTNVTAFDVTLNIVVGLAGTVLWLWMAHTNRGGRSWARILSTVLFAALTLTLPLTFIQVPYALVRVIVLAQWVLALAALVLLWVRPSSEFFAMMRRPANPPPVPTWRGPQPPGPGGVQRDPDPSGQVRQPGQW
jgi:serine/threonine protein kinase